MGETRSSRVAGREDDTFELSAVASENFRSKSRVYISSELECIVQSPPSSNPNTEQDGLLQRHIATLSKLNSFSKQASKKFRTKLTSNQLLPSLPSLPSSSPFFPPLKMRPLTEDETKAVFSSECIIYS